MRRNSSRDSTFSDEALLAGVAIGHERAGVEAIPLGTAMVQIRRRLIKLRRVLSSYDLVSRGAFQ
jgi:hypothetical protein